MEEKEVDQLGSLPPIGPSSPLSLSEFGTSPAYYSSIYIPLPSQRLSSLPLFLTLLHRPALLSL